MRIFFHKFFQKRYAKSPRKVQDKFDAQLEILYANRYDIRLNNHALHGKYAHHRSIDITGDIRAVYRDLGNKTEAIVFIDIGTHGELYS